MIKEFDTRQDRHSGAWMLFLETGRWLAFRLDIANSVYITIVALTAPLLSKYAGMSASDIGLSLTTCVQLLGKGFNGIFGQFFSHHKYILHCKHKRKMFSGVK